MGDSAPSPIIGYLKLTNRDADQSDLADKQLNVTLTVQNLKCEMSKKAGDVVATNTQIESLEHMKEREDTLRRFQGQVENDGNGTITNDVNNYICFGTSDSETCKKDTDKYMYRIIGIDTETNELKLIKKEALNTTQVWGETNQTWETSDLQIGLNNNLFLKNQSEYPYMQDNNDIETNWTKLISAHNWGYGDVPNSDIGFDGSTTSLQAYQNEKKALTSTLMNTKIGLMYASDYYLSGTANGEEDNLKCHYQASESDYVECTKSWMHLSNNDTAQLSTTNADTLSPHEWTISRSNNNRAWNVTGGGRVHYGVFSDASSVRPVFYISSSASIIEGNGSKDNPFKLAI